MRGNNSPVKLLFRRRHFLLPDEILGHRFSMAEPESSAEYPVIRPRPNSSAEIPELHRDVHLATKITADAFRLDGLVEA